MSDQEFKKPLEKMTAKELREVALEIEGIVGVHAMNKQELIVAIKEAKGIADDDDRKVDTGVIRKLKAEIKSLREKKEQLREAGDKKQLEILRKKISRLKKQTRRLAAG